ncbi:DUF4013 domain-containing protein [Calycomorphotria hydatis]|uniref:DUF4013 domain-containing protein n=1 Tax=Calycomorphotria hydatis TaxID=2528027 RepID=A0A517TAK3_9PLAN|nr:DUF4013 domain-containing protein [Calycomorphotria hydatis]QDT65396.1 hypothetical protein V22_26490 [Calycomorphotria hydatis]
MSASATITSIESSTSHHLGKTDSTVLEPNLPHHSPNFSSWLYYNWRGVGSLFSTVFVLSMLAAVPFVNVYVLGYFLEGEGNIARGGRWREALPSPRVMRRVASIIFGITLWLLPIRILNDFASDAALIAPGGVSAETLRTISGVYALVALFYVIAAISCSGRLMRFLNPFGTVKQFCRELFRGQLFRRAPWRVNALLASLKIKSRFWIGLKGLLVAFAWLAVPGFLLSVQGEEIQGTGVARVLGVFTLAIALMLLPLSQAALAATRHFRAALNPKKIWRIYRSAPWSFGVASIIAVLFAIPLVLFTIVELPKDAVFLIAPVFVLTAWPARLLTGAVYSLASQKERAHWLWWLSGIGWTYPLLLMAVGILYLLQFVSAEGRGVLFEINSLMLPLPG